VLYFDIFFCSHAKPCRYDGGRWLVMPKMWLEAGKEGEKRKKR